MRTPLVLGALALLAACTGSSDSAPEATSTIDTAATTSTATTSTATTSTATTSTATTSTVTTSSTTTTTTGTEPPTAAESTSTTTDRITSTTTDTTNAADDIEPDDIDPDDIDPADLAVFCAAGELTHLADGIADAVDPDPASIAASIAFLEFAVSEAVATAPPSLAEQPARAAFLVDEIGEAFAAADFDVAAVGESDDVDELETVLEEFTGLMIDLETFLVDACGSPVGTIREQARKIAPIIAEAAEWPLVPVTDDSGSVRLFVPTDWTDRENLTTDPSEIAGVRTSPDLAAYDASWGIPGVAAVVFFVEGGTADPTSREGITLAVECAPTGTDPYDDGLYTGELRHYGSCGGTDTAVDVLYATDDDRSTEVIVEFQIPADLDRVVIEQMLATFVAG